MFYLYFSQFNKNIHEVKNIAIRIVSCHTYHDTYRIVKMCIVTSLIAMQLPYMSDVPCINDLRFTRPCWSSRFFPKITEYQVQIFVAHIPRLCT